MGTAVDVSELGGPHGHGARASSAPGSFQLLPWWFITLSPMVSWGAQRSTAEWKKETLEILEVRHVEFK